MKIVYTKHALEKFRLLEKLGWKISKQKVNQTIRQPKWSGTSKLGQYATMSSLDQKHILRVIYDKVGDEVKVITFHPARKGKYETKI